ncbi:uncharacterized protein LACBIDRAFT_303622 [Laccaria bicolor S238N-H82]|uniref:Predicted protein n=1 Tax=Laccaria bicolor (strain S238N-H82 / ATCC MYA-4686) TaxID=486041 RepID=B0DJW2_LACBS|nr:uncharacterized protein LACBIDRAFT_303622 [Laccaria bicolor S238N-H82]EDR05188.1 predicted protein [Laccaria bicolor S238N-H82]|eukprot:XP_001884153.1 predicted protein [Laccaria bicolor S238N-H82]
MPPTQIYGTVTYLGNHNQTQVHDYSPSTSWNANLTSHPTAFLRRTITSETQASHS